MKKIYKQIVNFLSTNIFFGIVWVISVIQASWIAVSARYPMAFDEAYHLNIIKLHAKMVSPIFLEQPPGMATYGALVRDPSFLHHYLLSLPYRLFEYLGLSEYTGVIVLRFINIAMFAVGLILFKKLLEKTLASKAAINTAIFFFIMIPTVPLLAGQINYDNLQFPLIAWSLLLALKFVNKLKANKFDLKLLLSTLTVSLVGTYNKFTFLPIFTATVVYLLFVIVRQYRTKKILVKNVKNDWKKNSIVSRTIVVTTFSLSVALFIWFYGVNIVVHKNPIAQCGQVLGVARCQTYGPWARNHRYAQMQRKVDPNPLRYTIGWVGGMHYRLFFTINGSTGPLLYTNHTAPVVTITAAVLGFLGLLLSAKYIRLILRKDYVLVFLLFNVLIYTISVWGRNYHDYLQLGQNVAINGRYLQPILLPVMILMIAGFQRQLYYNLGLKISVLVLSSLLFLSGGGITGYIHYSTIDWFWEGRQFYQNTNIVLKRLVAPFFLWR